MFRAIDKWLPDYLRSVTRRPRKRPEHLLFCLADHFEPFRGGRSAQEARDDVREWCGAYRRSIESPGGIRPRHTFFYPAEEYDPACLDLIAAFCAAGYGEVEIHLHHRNDSADGLADKLARFRDTLRLRHGLLGSDESGRAAYGFIHGNWALCNSRPDGDWCGVNEELSVLAATGCYADFTFPSAPSPTQPRIVNSIYRASDTPGKPRGCDTGMRVRGQGSGFRVQGSGVGVRGAGGPPTSDHQPPITDHRSPSSLLLIQGPLALDWRRRKWGLLPRLENSEISGANPLTLQRAGLWVRQHIHVAGRPEWAFVKAHTHGLADKNRRLFMSGDMAAAFLEISAEFGAKAGCIAHLVSAREMFNIVCAAEDGKAGDPELFRNYAISRPPVLGGGTGN
jgi:hypothetical protein